MKKKLTIAFLLALTSATLSVAVACGKNSNDSSNGDSSSGSPEPVTTYTLTLQGGEGYSFDADGLQYNKTNDTYTAVVEENATFSFEVELGAFYAGNPTVTMDGVALSQKDGVYSVTLTKNANATVSGVRRDVSAMLGSGSFDDAYVVSRPIDLLYIAEQVNKGNTSYSRGYYVLANDIDCKGEELDVIGDMNNSNAFFSGCFSCYTEEETGVMERFSISNFTINADKSGYAGLFGFVQADAGMESSGLFYGIRIDDFTINVNATTFPVTQRAVYAGGLIGYGIGARLYLCDATNGKINVTSDANEYSFVGGLMGIAQGAYNSAFSYIALAEIAYANVDVDINISQGTALCAGGIAGYTLTNSLIAPAFIHNSYATGNVNGAIRSGGLVGILGQYTSIASSYASGDVVANARNSTDTDAISPESCIAYAGGLVGYGENDSVVNDSFSTGKLTAIAADKEPAQKTGRVTAGFDKAGTVAVNAQAHEILNCLTEVNLDSLITQLTQDLGWQTTNWNIQNKVLPTINYEASTECTTNITLNFIKQGENGVEKVTVNSATSEVCSYTDQYMPYVDALNQGMLPQYAQSGELLSYGVFFDEACTHPVPYSYVTTRDVDLYMGFADPTPIVGTYQVSIEGKTSPVTLTVSMDREVSITDGASVIRSTYTFDGETLMIEGARLARFFDGAVQADQSVNEDELFDMNRYSLYFFEGKRIDNKLSLYDGKYYTADAPLYAYVAQPNFTVGAYYTSEGAVVTDYTFYPDQTGIAQGGTIGYDTFTYTLSGENVTVQFANTPAKTIAIADLKGYDVFQGEWRKSASVNSFFSFDGIDKWEAFDRVYSRDFQNLVITSPKTNVSQGTYTLSPDGLQAQLYLNGNLYKTVKFNASGMMEISNPSAPYLTTVYTKDNAQLGLWTDAYESGTTLQLYGFDKDGLGKADLHYAFQVDGYNYTTDYALTYQVSETENYYCLYQGDAVFGYFFYEPFNNVLVATLLSPLGDGSYVQYYFTLNHEIDGKWISNDSALSNIAFDGNGAFNADGDWVGKLTVNGQEVTYTLTKYTLTGHFDYQNARYSIAYDPLTEEITVTKDGASTLQRQDELADIAFVDKYDTSVTVSFDGRSHLLEGGTMTVNGTDYKYTYVSAGNYAVSKDNVSGTLVYNETTASYTLTLDSTTYELYVHNDYMGKWAISGAFDAFTIYPSNVNGGIPALFQGQNVVMTYIDSTTLTFDCVINRMPKTYYVFLIKDKTGAFETFALSEYSSSTFGGYTFCEKVDSLFGTWTYVPDPDDAFMPSGMQMSMTFDGVNNNYTNGNVNLTSQIGVLPASSTAYIYKVQEDGEIFIWSQSPIGEKTYYYKLVACPATEKGVYVKGDKAYRRIQVDALYRTEAKADNGYTYLFDGMNTDDEHWGTVTATKDGETTKTYTYDVVAYNANQTATITLIDTATQEKFTATLNYVDPKNVTITLEKVEENA